MSADARKTKVAWLSVGSNTALVAGKLGAGLAIGSVSVMSEAVHSGVDLIAAVIALAAVRIASRPPDAEHPYGHGKAENISGTVEALLIFAAAGWILWEAARKLRHPEPLDGLGWGVAVMGVSAIVNLVVSQVLFRVGRETDSVALLADGWHLRTDVYTSVGVAVALGAVAAGRRFTPEVPLDWLDPAVAVLVALMILKAAWDLTRDSSRDLVDSSLPQAEEERIRECIEAYLPQVCGYHRLRTRKAGSQRFVDFHLLVDGAMSVRASHDLTDQITDQLRERFAGLNVTIHVEPCERDHDPGRSEEADAE